MTSAFGIDHGYVSKSFVNGTWKSASDLTGLERLSVARDGAYKKAKGVTKDDAKWLKRHMKGGKAMRQAAKKSKNRVSVDPTEPAAAATYRVGSAKGGKSYIVGSMPTKKLARAAQAHEMNHATPRRSAYRLHNQIALNPEKLMREEARADYRGTGHFTHHPPTGSAYAAGARAMQGVRDGKGGKPFPFPKSITRHYKYAEIPRPKNRDILTAARDKVSASYPHYNLDGKRGEKAIDAYRKLHNDMQAKGVPTLGHGAKPPKAPRPFVVDSAGTATRQGKGKKGFVVDSTGSASRRRI